MRVDKENKVVWCSEELVDWRESFECTSDPVMDMMHAAARVGYGWLLTDAEGKSMRSRYWDENQKKELMLAILENYEFKLEQPKKYYWRKKEEHLAWFEGDKGYISTLYFIDEPILEALIYADTFTEDEARDILKDDFDKFEKVEV